jgi:hypothetical protein
VAKKGAKTFPSWNSLGIAALQSKKRDLIKGSKGVLQGKLTRAAGKESKNFCFPFC